MTDQITARQFDAAGGVEDWRSLYHVVSAHFRTGSLANGIALVDENGRIASGVEQQYLNVDLRHAGVTVTLMLRDIALARRISAAARELDVPADPAAVQLVNVTLDALVGADVLPFWRALLGYCQIGDDYLSDPSRRGPGLRIAADERGAPATQPHAPRYCCPARSGRGPHRCRPRRGRPPGSAANSTRISSPSPAEGANHTVKQLRTHDTTFRDVARSFWYKRTLGRTVRTAALRTPSARRGRLLPRRRLYSGSPPRRA